METWIGSAIVGLLTAIVVALWEILKTQWSIRDALDEAKDQRVSQT